MGKNNHSWNIMGVTIKLILNKGLQSPKGAMQRSLLRITILFYLWAPHLPATISSTFKRSNYSSTWPAKEKFTVCWKGREHYGIYLKAKSKIKTQTIEQAVGSDRLHAKGLISNVLLFLYFDYGNNARSFILLCWKVRANFQLSLLQNCLWFSC